MAQKSDSELQPEEQKPGSSAGVFKVLVPSQKEWQEIKPEIADGSDNGEREQILAEARQVVQNLKEALQSGLQMPHVMVLAGSGTSMGELGGPSMSYIWECATSKAQDSEMQVDAIFKEIHYHEGTEEPPEEKQNIERLLSHCESYLEIHESERVRAFINSCKSIILEKCSSFLDKESVETYDGPLKGHIDFLHRLSRRRERDPRLKIFTTNYDVCFEKAASLLNLIVIDGFSFSQPRKFSPSYFDYDIVRRSPHDGEVDGPLSGVFKLFKLHGSVNWLRSKEHVEERFPVGEVENACLIYPAAGKFRQSYLQPHLELMSRYLASLRTPNTCLIVAGYGFNDDHLSEPIFAAARSNPQIRIFIVDYEAENHLQNKSSSPYWQKFKRLSDDGENVWLLNASFGDFAEIIPDLNRTSSLPEELVKALQSR